MLWRIILDSQITPEVVNDHYGVDSDRHGVLNLSSKAYFTQKNLIICRNYLEFLKKI